MVGKKLRVCMVFRNPCSNDPSVFREAGALAKEYEVFVLATPGKNLPKTEETHGFTIIRLPLIDLPLLRFISYKLLALWKSLFLKADVYQAHNLDNLVECYIASRINGAKLVYESHELFNQVYIGNVLGQFKRVFWLGLEKLLIHKADLIITTDRFRADFLKKFFSLSTMPIDIQNKSPLRKIKPAKEVLAFAKQHKNSIKIVYEGSLNQSRTDAIRNFVIALNYVKKPITLAFVGNVSDSLKEELHTLLAGNTHVSLEFLGMQTISKMFEYISVMDVGILFYPPVSINNYLCSPNKVFDYIQAGIPSICNSLPYLRSIIGKERIGLVLDSDDPKSIADELTKFFRSGLRAAKSRTLRVQKKYSWEKEEHRILDAYKSMLD